jgi:hypothetical protein
MPAAVIFGASLARGLRAFPAATFAARFFAGALSDLRLERRGRDFDPMILPV